MKRVIFALVAALAPGVAGAQGAPAYAPAENPFQGDYEIALREPVVLRVDVLGVRLDDVTLTPLAEPTGERINCEVAIAGDSAAKKKAELTVVLLFEDAAGKGLERAALDVFKVKSGKKFRETQEVPLAAATLAGMKRVYVFVQVAF